MKRYLSLTMYVQIRNGMLRLSTFRIFCKKNGAEILKTEKWGEKKLAYKVKGT